MCGFLCETRVWCGQTQPSHWRQPAKQLRGQPFKKETMAQPKTPVQDQAFSKTYELVPIWLHFLAVASPRGEELNEGLLAQWATTSKPQTSQQSNTWQREHTFPSNIQAPLSVPVVPAQCKNDFGRGEHPDHRSASHVWMVFDVRSEECRPMSSVS
jgi:hypothetical protein